MAFQSYRHRQSAPIYWILLSLSLLVFLGGLFLGAVLFVILSSLISLLMGTLAFMFVWLEVAEDGESLSICFGPIRAFKKRVRYDSIVDVVRDRSLLIEGWGVHLGPRGWIWNLWGRQVVELQFEQGRLRIGTDDPEGLLAHVKERSALS